MFISKNASRSFTLLTLLMIFFTAGLVTSILPEVKLLSSLDSLPKVCPLRLLTGYLCSFCGMTHAWVYFWHADFADAARENALAIGVFTAAPLYFLSLHFTQFWTKQRTQISVWFVLILLCVYTLLRNL